MVRAGGGSAGEISRWRDQSPKVEAGRTVKATSRLLAPSSGYVRSRSSTLVAPVFGSEHGPDREGRVILGTLVLPVRGQIGTGSLARVEQPVGIEVIEKWSYSLIGREVADDGPEGALGARRIEPKKLPMFPICQRRRVSETVAHIANLQIVRGMHLGPMSGHSQSRLQTRGKSRPISPLLEDERIAELGRANSPRYGGMRSSPR